MTQVPSKTSGPAPNKLEAILQDRVACLGDLLQDVEHSMQERHELSTEVIREIDEQYLAVKNILLSLEAWPQGSAQWADDRRQELEKELSSLSREQRGERISCWQDVAHLAEEARTRTKEYRDLLQRTRILLPQYTSPATYTVGGSQRVLNHSKSIHHPRG